MTMSHKHRVILEIGVQSVAVGPFTTELSASGWVVNFLNELRRLNKSVRSIRVVHISSSSRFIDVDVSMGDEYASPASVARDIECLEHCRAEARSRGFALFDAGERVGLALALVGLYEADRAPAALV